MGAALITIPVALAGWVWGSKTGLVASLFGILLNTALLIAFEENNLNLWISIGWPGNLMLILVGYISGRLSDTINQFKLAEASLRSRERYLTLLKMATSSTLNLKPPGDRYYDLITHFVNLLVADYGYYIGWDAKQNRAALIASTVSIEQQFSGVSLEPDKSAFIKRIVQTKSTVAVDDMLNSQDIFNSPPFTILAHPVQSALAIPLMARDDILGIIILAYKEPRNFTAEEINQAEQGGQQVALALRSIQQEHKIEKQLLQTTTLSNVEHVLSRSERVGVDAVLQLIVDSAMELIPKTKHVVLHLLDEEHQTLIPRSVAGLAEGHRSKLNMRLGKGVAGQVLETGKTIYIPDIRVDPRFIGQTLPISYRSILVAPIRSDERCIGTISIHSDDIGAFDADDASLLEALGIKATIALENAGLLDATKQALRESNALYRINQKMIESLEPQQLFKDVVNLLQKIFGYYHVQIYVVDSNTGDFVLQYGSGEIGKTLKEQEHRLPAGEGIAGFTAETGAPFIATDVNDTLSFVHNSLLPDTKSELTVPIKSEGRILGLIDIHQVKTASLTEKDLKLVSAVADQLGVALQKAGLYKDLQESLQHEKAIRNQLVQNERLAVMGRLLASVSHELNNPLQAIQNALFLLKEEKGISSQGKHDLDIVLAEAERMAHMIEQLRVTYRPIQAEDFNPIQINNIVEDVYALVSTHLRHNNISFEFQPDPTLPEIPGLVNQIRQVILNIIMNAVEAMKESGQLCVTTKYGEDGSEVFLSISDNGPGIDPSILPNIFEAFITNKESGTGLGLTISHDIVLKHQGRITAENNPEGGATIKIWLPTKGMEIQ